MLFGALLKILFMLFSAAVAVMGIGTGAVPFIPFMAADGVAIGVMQGEAQ
jgi:hypothetical protein